MVTMLEVNRDLLRDFFDGDLLSAYRFVVNYGDTTLSIPTKQVQKLVVSLLHRANFTPKQIRHMTGVSFYMSKKHDYKFSKSFLSAVSAINSVPVLMDKAEYYSAIPIPISKPIVERLIIEDLVLAGWSIKQIEASTGFSIHRIKRKYKELA